MIYKLKRFSSYLERSFAVVNPAVAKPAVPNTNPAMQQGKGGGLGGLVSMAVPAVVPTVVMGIANSRSSSGSSEEDTEQ